MKYILWLFFLLSLSLSAKHKFIAADTTTNGNVLLCTKNVVLELSMDKKVLWSFERKGEMHSAQRLADGNTLIGHTTEAAEIILH